MVIFLENEDKIFIRRLRLLVDGSRFYISVSKLANPWADTALIQKKELEALEKVKRWVTMAVASFWFRHRCYKLFIELDIRHGGLTFKIHDWGIANVPDNPFFHRYIEKQGRTEFAESVEGFFYDTPDVWEDSEIAQQNYKTLAAIIAEEVQRSDQGGTVDIFVPPPEDA